jgi:hypothetical protein
MVSLKTHNILDYVGGAVLILAPFLFGFADVNAARNVFMIGGFALIAYSLFTNYYYSLARVIPLGVHMTLDTLNGVLLITAPWIFNYREFLTPGQEYLHYIVGVGVFALVAVTREKTETDKIEHGIHLDIASATGRL